MMGLVSNPYERNPATPKLGYQTQGQEKIREGYTVALNAGGQGQEKIWDGYMAILNADGRAQRCRGPHGWISK